MKRWPQDYQSWTGSFEDLVTTANEVLHQVDPTAKALTSRTVRHYQQEGGVARGKREGRASQFTYGDLASMVATKSLVKDNWSVRNAGALLNSTPTHELAHVAPSASQPTAAMQVVRDLLHKSPLSGQTQTVISPSARVAVQAYVHSAPAVHPPKARSLSTTQGAGVLVMGSRGELPRSLQATPEMASADAVCPSYTGTPEHGLRAPMGSSLPGPAQYAVPTLPHITTQASFAPWLHVTLDDALFRQAAAPERAAAVDGLIAWLNTLR